MLIACAGWGGRLWQCQSSNISKSRNSTVHYLLNPQTTCFMSYKDIKVLMADLKRVYALLMHELEAFGEKWNAKYPKIMQSWEANWPKISAYYKFSQEVWTLIYTTNAIEGFNRQLRKITKSKSIFPPTTVCLKCCIWLWGTSPNNGRESTGNGVWSSPNGRFFYWPSAKLR